MNHLGQRSRSLESLQVVDVTMYSLSLESPATNSFTSSTSHVRKEEADLCLLSPVQTAESRQKRRREKPVFGRFLCDAFGVTQKPNYRLAGLEFSLPTHCVSARVTRMGCDWLAAPSAMLFFSLLDGRELLLRTSFGVCVCLRIHSYCIHHGHWHSRLH